MTRVIVYWFHARIPQRDTKRNMHSDHGSIGADDWQHQPVTPTPSTPHAHIAIESILQSKRSFALLYTGFRCAAIDTGIDSDMQRTFGKEMPTIGDERGRHTGRQEGAAEPLLSWRTRTREAALSH